MTTPDHDPILEVVDLHKNYLRGPEEVHALRGASFTLHRGEVVALVGPSGSGKTTLLNLLYGWESPDQGEVVWQVGSGDAGARRPWGEVAILPQDLGLLEELPVRENVELPIRLGGSKVGPEARERMAALLTEFGLEQLADRAPSEISLGEQQRAALARALVLQPFLLLADEPTGHQDAGWARTTFRAFREAADAGVTSFVATHSREFLRFADRILAIRDGLVHPVAAPSEAPAADAAEDDGWHREIVGSPDDEFEWKVSPSR